MGAVSSALDPGRGTTVPDGYVRPPFPSLYKPTFRSTQLQVGVFLYEAEAIWEFTLFWTLIFLGGIFLICSLVASTSLLLSLTLFRPPQKPPPIPPVPPAPDDRPPTPATADRRRRSEASRLLVKKLRARRKRPPLWPVFLLPVVMTAIAGVVGLVSGTVVGFALAAVYTAGSFSMSTWIPFLWALIQVCVLIISQELFNFDCNFVNAIACCMHLLSCSTVASQLLTWATRRMTTIVPAEKAVVRVGNRSPGSRSDDGNAYDIRGRQAMAEFCRGLNQERSGAGDA